MSAGILQALQKDVGGTLTFDVIEGVPSAVSVSLYDLNGALLVTGTPTITGQRLSYAVTSGYVTLTGDTYRAQWSYTARGVAEVRQMTWAVKKRLAYHQLTTARLVSDYYPNLGGRYPSGVTSWDLQIDAAWRDYQGRLRAQGLDPHRVMDTAPVEPIVAALAAYRIATGGFSFGSASTNDWQAWGAAREADAKEKLQALLSSVGWYDVDEDLIAVGGETDVNVGYVRLTR